MKPFIVTSDLHLSADSSAATVRDLARLLYANPGHDFILAGDVFNLSWEAPGRSAVDAVLALVSAHPELASAFRAQLAGGAPLTLLAGNHDAGLISTEIRDALLAQAGAGPKRPAGDRTLVRATGRRARRAWALLRSRQRARSPARRVEPRDRTARHRDHAPLRAAERCPSFFARARHHAAGRHQPRPSACTVRARR